MQVLLDCSNNEIEELPPDIKHLTRLCTLIVSRSSPIT